MDFKCDNRSRSQCKKSIVAVDLFCGAGGLTRGLLDAGIEVAAGYDILQSFPEDSKFVKPGGEYCFKTIERLIGNAAPVWLSEVVGRTISRHLKELGVYGEAAVEAGGPAADNATKRI